MDPTNIELGFRSHGQLHGLTEGASKGTEVAGGVPANQELTAGDQLEERLAHGHIRDLSLVLRHVLAVEAQEC